MLDYSDAAHALAEADVEQWIGARAAERYANRPEIIAGLNVCVAERRTIRSEVRFR